MATQADLKRLQELEAKMGRRGKHHRVSEPSSDLSDRVRLKVRDALYWLQHHTQALRAKFENKPRTDRRYSTARWSHKQPFIVALFRFMPLKGQWEPFKQRLQVIVVALIVRRAVLQGGQINKSSCAPALRTITSGASEQAGQPLTICVEFSESSGSAGVFRRNWLRRRRVL
jgi:hypothetical protein